MLKTKVSLNGDLRRVTVPVIDFEVLTQKIREIYLLAASQRFRVRFQDPDGDFVTISNDAGLADALTCCADTEILRLFVDLVPTAPILSGASSSCAPPLTAASEQERRREDREEEEEEDDDEERERERERETEDHFTHHHAVSHSFCPALTMDADQRQQMVETVALVEALEEAAKEAELAKLVAIHRRIAARRQTLTTESRKMAAKSRRLCQRGSAVERKIGALVRRSPHLAEQAAEAGILLPSQRGRSHAFCDSCNSAILLTETRYKCSMCFDFDLCQRCEAAAVHDPSHPMLKMQPEAQQRPTPTCELELWWEAACQEFFTMLRTTSLSHIVVIAFASFVLSFFSAYALASLIAL